MATPFKADKVQTNVLLTTGSAGSSGIIQVTSSFHMDTTGAIVFSTPTVAMSASTAGVLNILATNTYLSSSLTTNKVEAKGGFTGSLMLLGNGTSYLVATDNITITSASNGQVVFSVSTGSGGSGTAITGTFTVSDSVNFLKVGHTTARDVFLSASQGAIYIAPGGNSGIVAVSSSNATACQLAVQCELNNVSSIDLREVGNTRFQFKADNVREQFLAAMHADVMRKFILTDTTLLNKDFDHAVAEHPTFVLHSITDPDTNNTQWVSFACNTTDGVIDTGANRNLRLSGSGFYGYATQKTGSVSISGLDFNYGGGGFAAVMPGNISGSNIPFIKNQFGNRNSAAASVRIPAGATIIDAKAAISVTAEGDFALMRVNATGSAWDTATKIGGARTTTSGAQDLQIGNLTYVTPADGGAECYYVIIDVNGSDERIYGAQVSYVTNNLAV